MLSSVLITNPARLRGLRSSWEELLARSATSDINVHPAWLLEWWDVFGDASRELRTLAFYDGEALVGLAPMLTRRYVYRPGIPFRRLELLGSGEDEADETCADYLGLLAEAGREAEVARAFAAALTDTSSRGLSSKIDGWDELVLSSMSGSAAIPALLRDALAARGISVELRTWSSAPYVPLPRTWDEYLAQLKPSRRMQLRKALRSFEAWAGAAPTLTRVRSRADLAVGKKILVALHRERWGTDGVFGSRKFCEFHDRLMPELLARDALDLGWLAVRGRPVAAFYNFRFDGKLSFYQSGRRLDVPDGARVGMAMHASIIRSAIEAGLREYDFLAGASQYKTTMSLASRPLVMLRASRDSVMETARRTSALGMEKAKQLRRWVCRDAPPSVRSMAQRFLREGWLRERVTTSRHPAGRDDDASSPA